MTYEPVTLENLLQHQDWAMRVARKLVREESEAEDLLQRTWMAALRRPPQNEGGTRAWLRKVILNLARERHRRREARERHERASAGSLAEPGGPTEPDALEKLSREEMNALLGAQLLALKEPYRAVLLSRYFDDLSSAEIARRLGIPAGTVRWRLKVGLDLLRDELDKKSAGDRARWVSALVAFLPRGAGVADVAEEELGPEGASVAVETTGALAVAGWAGLAVLGLAGVVLLLRDPERGAEPAVAALPSAGAADRTREPDGPVPVTTNASERTGLSPSPAVESAVDAARGPALDVLVTDSGGVPLANASILLAGVNGAEERATSDADGRARLVLAPEDIGALGLPATRERVSLRALAPGRAASPLVHAARPLERMAPVVLVAGGPEVVRRGRVVDTKGAPVADACVAWVHPYSHLDQGSEDDFASPGYLATASDPEGHFALANLPDEPGHLHASAPGFAAWFSVLEPAASTEETVVVLQRGATVSGTVRRANGMPAANVRVGFEPLFKASEWATGLARYDARWRGFAEATRTDEHGAYTLTGVAAGERWLWAHAEEEDLVADERIVLQDGAATVQDVVLEERTGFRLRFVDEGGRPLAGWIAHIRRPVSGGGWWIRRDESDVDGRLRVADAPRAPGTDGYFLDVFDPSGAGASWLACKLRPDEAEQTVTIETRASSTVAGRMLDHAGEPQLDGTLTFHSLRTTQEMRAERDARGEFTLRLAPGSYMLVLQLEATAVKLARVDLAPGEHRELGVLASPALGTLRLDSPSAAAPGVMPSVALFTAIDTERAERYQPVGRADVPAERALALFPGRYRVLAHDGTHAKPREHFVEVRAHAETRLDPWR